MKGDFSRIRFNRAKLYTAVLEQQGRVDLDSDANEQRAIDVTLRQTTNADIIGPCGGPADSAGFAISVEDDEIWITAGRYYVNGLLVEIPARVNYNSQPYLIDPTHTSLELLESLARAGEGASLRFTLEVWQRMATSLDDPCLLEPALNQADTTTRLQTIWRVVGTLDTIFPVTDHTGLMGAALSGGGSGCGCQPIPAAGYQGMENQLYRVEIHQAGDLTSATFKWSRENGSVLTRIKDVNSPTVTVASLGPDANLGFQVGQWVELTDDTNQFGPTPNQAGTLYQILSVNHPALQVTLNAPITGLRKNRNPRMRRWDQSGATAAASGIPVSSTPIALENGIEVNFSRGQFQVGDYWAIPARTANGSIDWPPCGGDGLHFQPSSHMSISRAPLACISRARARKGRLTELGTVVFDLRSFFPPLAAKAIHIQEISWKNADLLSFDALVANGLDVSLNVLPTSHLDAAVFRVSLEIAATNLREYARTKTATDNAVIEKNPVGLSIGPALRQEYVLDGVVTVGARLNSGWLVHWAFPGDTGQGELAYAVNSLLLDASKPTLGLKNRVAGVPAARVRVRLYGRDIFATPALRGCGPANTIFLDGQCFGAAGLLSSGSTGVALTQPSGANVLASDFESWFYLAPAPQVETVVFNPSALKLNAGEAAGAAGLPTSGTSTGTVQLTAAAATDVNISLTTSTQTGVALTLSSASIVIPAGSTSQTFTATVQTTPEAPNGQVTLTVTAAPQVETAEIGQIFSASGDLDVSITNPLAIETASLPAPTVNHSYSTTLVATGGTPPYKWRSSDLPPELSTSEAGVISGKAGKPGEFKVGVYVTDSASPAATANKQLTLEVDEPLTITTTSPLPGGLYGGVYRTQLDATGGKGPYRWAKTAGNLVAGLSVNGGGAVAGTPTAYGETTFTVEVTDSANPANKALKNFVIDISAPIQ